MIKLDSYAHRFLQWNDVVLSHCIIFFSGCNRIRFEHVANSNVRLSFHRKTNFKIKFLNHRGSNRNIFPVTTHFDHRKDYQVTYSKRRTISTYCSMRKTTVSLICQQRTYVCYVSSHSWFRQKIDTNRVFKMSKMYVDKIKGNVF